MSRRALTVRRLDPPALGRAQHRLDDLDRALPDAGVGAVLDRSAEAEIDEAMDRLDALISALAGGDGDFDVDRRRAGAG